MPTKFSNSLLFLALIAIVLTACSGPKVAATEPAAAAPAVTATSPAATEPEATATSPAAAATEPEPTVAKPVATATTAPQAEEPALPVTGEVSFARDVLPILEANCTKCHGDSRQRAGLAMNTYAALMAGATDGAVIIPLDAAGSLLVQVTSSGEMPKNGTPLGAGKIKIIMDWIDAGALDN